MPSRPAFSREDLGRAFALGQDIGKEIVRQVLAGLGHFCDDVRSPEAESQLNKDRLRAQTERAPRRCVWRADLRRWTASCSGQHRPEMRWSMRGR